MSLDVSLKVMQLTSVYSDNITHNLNKMATAAGLYHLLWRPEELFTEPKASDLIPGLEKGLAVLKASPNDFWVYEPDNGWGDYAGLVRFTETYLQACKNNPDALVYAER